MTRRLELRLERYFEFRRPPAWFMCWRPRSSRGSFAWGGAC